MTYFGVLLTFIVPPLALLAMWVPRDVWLWLLRRGPRPDLLPYQIVLIHVVMALVYTTPWDNYLVATGVWWYDPALVTGIRLGWVPVEEYTFFVLQTLLTGFWTIFLLRRIPSATLRENPGLRAWTTIGLGVAWVVMFAVWISGWQPGVYLSLILIWAIIPFISQAAFGADILAASWRALFPAIAVPTGYLWLVDGLSISSGTWTIDPQQTTGLMLGPLPFEEMLFFAVTNMIVALGVTLMVSPYSHGRGRQLLAQWQAFRTNRQGLSQLIRLTEARLGMWLGSEDQQKLLRPWLIALLVWVCGLIATPIGIWIVGESSFVPFSTFVVLAQLAATLVALRMGRPFAWVVGISLLTMLLTWAAEYLGLATGLLFGQYAYTSMLQPQLWGVPLLIPFAWLMMLGPAWGVADVILGRRAPDWLFAALSGLAFTAWDLFLDPQMVARGLWAWQEPGVYFGIPVSNFLGWWLTATLISLVLRPRRLAQRPLLIIYTLTWFFQTLGLGLFWAQPLPALAGFVGMGLFVILAWRKVLN
jgi:putative membrane protein